jgi:hypothetical protein
MDPRAPFSANVLRFAHLEESLREPATPGSAPCKEVGAQTERRDRLRAEGHSEEEIGRLHGAIGLDLILAEMTAVRCGGSAARS